MRGIPFELASRKSERQRMKIMKNSNYIIICWNDTFYLDLCLINWYIMIDVLIIDIKAVVAITMLAVVSWIYVGYIYTNIIII